MSNLNKSITSNDIEALRRDPPTKKSPGQKGVTAECYLTFKQVISRLLKLFHKIEREGTLTNSFHETCIILIPKQNKDTQRKELIDIDTKILIKKCTNKIKQHIKKIISIFKLSRMANHMQISKCNTTQKPNKEHGTSPKTDT
jgi:hypothetical protein